MFELMQVLSKSVTPLIRFVRRGRAARDEAKSVAMSLAEVVAESVRSLCGRVCGRLSQSLWQSSKVSGNHQNIHSRKHGKVVWTGINVGWTTHVQNYSRRSKVMLNPIIFPKITKNVARLIQLF